MSATVSEKPPSTAQPEAIERILDEEVVLVARIIWTEYEAMFAGGTRPAESAWEKALHKYRLDPENFHPFIAPAFAAARQIVEGRTASPEAKE